MKRIRRVLYATDFSRELNQLADKARVSGVKATTALCSGDPVGEIIRTARTEGTDLIVVGTHGRHGLPKFFLGSVAEPVVATAPCPVVTVRGA